MLTPSDSAIAQWILFLIQIITLIALCVYVWKTWEMAAATHRASIATAQTTEEMRRSREAASAPRVVVYFATTQRNLAEIVIENYGEGTAHDVRVEFDPPLQSSDDSYVSKYFEGPKILPPKSRQSNAFDVWTSFFNSTKDLPHSYQVTITYKGFGSDTQYCDVFSLDAGAFKYLASWRMKDFDDFVDQFEKARNEIKNELGKIGGQLSLALDLQKFVIDDDSTASYGDLALRMLTFWNLCTAAKELHLYTFWSPILEELKRLAIWSTYLAVKSEAPSSHTLALRMVLDAVGNPRLKYRWDNTFEELDAAFSRLSATLGIDSNESLQVLKQKEPDSSELGDN